MVTPESRQIEQYIRGLDPRLQEMANAVYPLTMQDVLNKVEYLAGDILSQTPPGKTIRAEISQVHLRARVVEINEPGQERPIKVHIPNVYSVGCIIR